MKFSIHQLFVVICIAALALQIRRINQKAEELKRSEVLLLRTWIQHRELVYDPEIEKSRQLSREIKASYRSPLDIPTITSRFEVLQSNLQPSNGQPSN